MDSAPPSLHVYQREIDTAERTSLSVLAARIPAGARVLDLGCGSGAIGRHLAARGGAGPIDGLTISQDEADLAAPHYRRVEVANLESADLTALFAPAGYDIIVCADVLEHIRHPEHVLAQCRTLLADGGHALLSIPNAGYVGLLAELMAGEFRYRPEGLLDETHLRFFTRRTLLRMLTEARWAVDHVETVQRQLPDSEFNVAFDALPPAVARHLLALPDALTYQFIVATHPAAAALAVSDPMHDNMASIARQPDLLPAQALYSAQLYWDDGEGYAEDRKCVRAGVIGQGHQHLHFTLPAGVVVRQLKFDPADRPGILYLYSLTLREASRGNVIWRWSMSTDGSQALLARLESQQMAWGVIADGTALSAVLCGDDPWVKLPIATDVLAQVAADGELVLDTELGWPMSADYMSLVGMIAPLQAEQTLLRAQAGRVTQVLADHEKLALEHAQLHRLHADLHRELVQERHERRHLFAERDRMRTEVANVRAELKGMAEHVDNLSNLRSVRYGQKLSGLLRLGKSSALTEHPAASGAPALDTLPPLNATNKATATAQTSESVPHALSDTVDIIVPVYRGLSDTRLCVESVLNSTLSTQYRLIVINDCSPEPEVTAWLRDKAALEPRITLLENEQNLGFVGTVNRGMKHSVAHDVLLLNSDTEVAGNWLDRLRRSAYAAAKVASVTPFSNNATICSYPSFCAANPVPDGETTASLDGMFARANAGQIVDVPTGVGFCMYIRRDCLNEVGFFDEEHFGKGYGEENDFCQRAQAKGWRNLHALDCYVLHTGGVSFGDTKSPREQAAMRILAKLHPSYDAQVQAFVKIDPAAKARLAVDWLRATDQGKKPVVLAVHHQRGGGTERHVLELARTLADTVTFVSLKPTGAHHVMLQWVCPVAVVGRPDQSLATLATEPSVWSLSTTGCAVLNLVDELPTLLQLLRTLGVVHVHYHHLLGHHEVIWDLPRLLGVSYDFTSHDFYSHCTNITLTGNDNRYHVVDDQGECCGGTHPPSLPNVVEKIDDWRIRNRLFLERARYVLSPSLDTASRMHQAFPTAAVRFAPHPDLDCSTLVAPTPRTLCPDRPLRVLVIGALSIIKGADVLEQTARLAKKAGAAIEFHLIGFGYRHLQSGPGSALTVYGQYEEAQLPALIQRIGPDVAWFPALWPETYSYTLSAALTANLPVVVPNLGAFIERVAERPWSWVQAWDSTPEQWIDVFHAVRTQLLANSDIVPVAPAMPAALSRMAQMQGAWDYHRDYVGFAAAVQSGDDALRRAQEIGQFFANANRLNPPPDPARGALYGLALRLQRAPMLGPVMRNVPQGLRFHIKRLLSR
ncbi:methyltransferase domain-containing protein [Ottowia sp.]|uniref:methyltransferase domain-containing protein n=1 Tax=Ottowia sp. TaxID=1898956 RepID=UPI0039648581